VAAFAVVDYATPVGSLLEVLAAVETKLETLDSTTNALRFIDVQRTGGDAYVGIIVYDG
jgi:hypothetical protein